MRNETAYTDSKTVLTIPPIKQHRTFLYSEPDFEMRLERVDVAFIGIPFGSGYSFAEQVPDQAMAPCAMRRATDRILRSLERYDFDLGGPLYDNRAVRAVDCGDVWADVSQPTSHTLRAELAVRKILASGALPIVLGGDHGITIPVLRALDGVGPVTVVQIDQHIDWRDEVAGVLTGVSSPMRRASEMAHVRAIYQIGLRASGSAREEEVRAARAYSAQLITAYEVDECGVSKILDRIPGGGNFYITVDMDGLDPSCAPGVLAPCPGGLSFAQARSLIRGIANKGNVVGMDIVEITPSRDVNNLTSITAGRLIVNLLGTVIRNRPAKD